MALFPVRQYQPGAEFVVVRAMDYGERHFEAGDLFPWRELGIHEATVQMLWKAVRIEVKREPAALDPPAAASTAPAVAPEPGTTAPITSPAYTELTEVELERLTAPTTPAPAAPRAKAAPNSTAKPTPLPSKAAARPPQQNQLPRR